MNKSAIGTYVTSPMRCKVIWSLREWQQRQEAKVKKPSASVTKEILNRLGRKNG